MKKTTKTTLQGPASDEEFILAWQRAETLAQAAAAAHMTPKAAKGKACYMRGKGIDLRRFHPAGGMDVERLKEIAKKAAR